MCPLEAHLGVFDQSKDLFFPVTNLDRNHMANEVLAEGPGDRPRMCARTL